MFPAQQYNAHRLLDSGIFGLFITNNNMMSITLPQILRGSTADLQTVVVCVNVPAQQVCASVQAGADQFSSFVFTCSTIALHVFCSYNKYVYFFI